MTELQRNSDDLGSRLGGTRTFRNGGLARWREARVFVVGAGTIGQRFSLEALLSGARVTVCDPDFTTRVNSETQFGLPGTAKVDHLAARAESIAPGRLVPVRSDVRHVGIGQLVGCDLVVDCTDDPGLALPLTRISNGLRIPLLRAAVDGSGDSELGRVACSDGGRGHACHLCTYDLPALLKQTQRTPCPGQLSISSDSRRRPTIAGGAIGSIVAGIALLQAQRLVTGNDLDQVIDQQLIIDLLTVQLLPIRRKRCADCLSGHVEWELAHLPQGASEITWGGVVAEARRRLGSHPVSLEPFDHPLSTAAFCSCGSQSSVVGTRWAPLPECAACGQAMRWREETALDRLTVEAIADLRIGDVSLDRMALPEGAMIVVRAPGRPPLRLVLHTNPFFPAQG